MQWSMHLDLKKRVDDVVRMVTIYKTQTHIGKGDWYWIILRCKQETMQDTCKEFGYLLIERNELLICAPGQGLARGNLPSPQGEGFLLNRPSFRG